MERIESELKRIRICVSLGRFHGFFSPSASPCDGQRGKEARQARSGQRASPFIRKMARNKATGTMPTRHCGRFEDHRERERHGGRGRPFQIPCTAGMWWY